jgi:predicted nuclease of restriction endonuclease-like (RecB) superfamily
MKRNKTNLGGKDSRPVSTEEYLVFLKEIKADIRNARIRAVLAASREHIGLYWNIGKKIVFRQETSGWGKAIVERLSEDLQKEYPGVSGYSSQNLWYMRQFYLEYRDSPNLQRLVGEIPWGQNIEILSKTGTAEEKEYYLKATAEMGWTRNVLLHQIKADAFGRQAKGKLHNFKSALPAHRAEQAEGAIKSIYMLDFLDVAKPIHERELERRMVIRIRDVLMELGKGFSFIGNQYKISSPTKDYYIDLLFFNRKINCLVAVELKAGPFEAEYVAKMGLYLGLLNDIVREKHENHPIGLILCAEHDHIEVEYALKTTRKPMGVAEYKLTKSVPAALRKYLPDTASLSARIHDEMLNWNVFTKNGKIGLE